MVRRWTTVVVVVVSVLCVACYDPTEQAVTVTIQNDTPGSVTVRQCDTTCGVTHEVHSLPPGGSVRVNSSSRQVSNYWLIVDQSGAVTGCLNLLTKEKQARTFKISDTAPCPSSAKAP